MKNRIFRQALILLTIIICNNAFAIVPKENGAIKAEFSVSPTKKIYFSQGNLQYQVSTDTWQFARRQFDMIGIDNEKISTNYDGWIDLFGWGTSGYDGKYPYMSTTTDIYYIYGENDIASTNYDWGVYNAISNGSDKVGEWRTLTYEEWDYILNTRPDADLKYGVACIDGINGLVFLPDNWNLPKGAKFKNGVAPFYGSEYFKTINQYTIAEWNVLENEGAVFLPAAGYRDGTEIINLGKRCYYWTATHYYSNFAIDFHFQSSNVDTGSGCRYYGQSVRLVKDVE